MHRQGCRGDVREDSLWRLIRKNMAGQERSTNSRTEGEGTMVVSGLGKTVFLED